MMFSPPEMTIGGTRSGVIFTEHLMPCERDSRVALASAAHTAGTFADFSRILGIRTLDTGIVVVPFSGGFETALQWGWTLGGADMKPKTRRWMIVGLVVAILVAVGAFVAKGRGEDVPAITIQSIERMDLVSTVRANGKIEAQRKVDLSANVMGQIVNLAVREGETVAKGDFLLQIDQTQLEASAAGARASLAALLHDRDAARSSAVEAKLSYERAQKSASDELIAQSELDRAKAAFDSAESAVASSERRIEQARANLAGARDTLSKTKLVAPMSGTVTRLPVEEGEVAVIGTMNNPGTVLMTISDMATVEAVMEVDETDVPFVRIGQPAEILIDAYGDEIFHGVVTEVGSSPIQLASAEAVNFEVKVQLEAPPEGVRPGFSCSGEVITDRRDGAIAAPLQALVVREAPTEDGSLGEDEEGVYLFERQAPGEERGSVRFAAVTTGITGEIEIEIVDGLAEGAEVVTGPFRVLREIEDGDEVELEPEDEEEEDGR